MRPVTRRRLAVVAFVLVAFAAALAVARPYAHGLSLVVRAANLQGTWRRMADLDTVAVRERVFEMSTPGGPLRARAYEPAGGIRRTALVVSGLHPSGIDEPRLRRLSRDLAGSGVAVVTPDVPELTRFEITPGITEAIEQSARWLASDRTFAPDGRVGLMGISFSGGLSIVAAGRPSLAGRVAYVVSLGGHDDLPRVLRYLCSGVVPPPRADEPTLRLNPDGPPPVAPPPHDYGVAVILLGLAERVVPPAQVEPLRAAVRHYLWASALDGGVDKAQAPREFDAVRELTKTLPEPSATLLRYVVDRDVAHLGARLLPFVGLYGADPALSVSRSPKPSAPVFLLHGVNDNVIPAVESQYLAEDLRGHAQTRLLLSGLISHAEADRPPRIGDVLQLASFWGDLLAR